MSAIGPIYQGVAQSLAYHYQSQVASVNAQIMRQQARTTLMEGSNEESAAHVKTGLMVGQMKAAQGANAVDVSGGSAAAVRGAVQTEGDLDALTIRYNAARRAYGYGVEAQNYGYQAKMASAAGTNALVGGIIQGFSTFVGSSSSMLDTFYKMQQVGAA